MPDIEVFALFTQVHRAQTHGEQRPAQLLENLAHRLARRQLAPALFAAAAAIAGSPLLAGAAQVADDGLQLPVSGGWMFAHGGLWIEAVRAFMEAGRAMDSTVRQIQCLEKQRFIPSCAKSGISSADRVCNPRLPSMLSNSTKLIKGNNKINFYYFQAYKGHLYSRHPLLPQQARGPT